MKALFRTFLVAFATAAVAVTGVFLAAPAQADLYRYWSFWQLQGDNWEFYEGNPADVIPANGSVEGWRYGVGGTAASDVRPPRSTVPFGEICTGDAAPAGQKQVGVIIDTGTQQDVPATGVPPEPTITCVTTSENANALQVLQATESARVENGLVCGIAGYPASGCGDVVAGATAVPNDSPTEFAVTQQESEGSSGSPLPAIAIGVVVVVIIVAAVFIARSRKNSAG